MNPVDLENRILGAPPAARPAAQAVRPAGASFGQVLQDQMAAQAARAGVKFSGHAQARLASRQITLSGEDVSRIGEAMTRAAAKGARESLVLMDKAALVVSVPNRTVITAVDKAALKENIFTNIDSAMIL
ncbi:MAG: hypothetical protein JO250_21335 [Armatimonadetes bacterium]|nr:hypothetical protein [Armatimonadota bacterium]